MKTKLQVLDQQVGVSSLNGIEYICITGIARFKSSDYTDDLIRNWLRNLNTIEFLGVLGAIEYHLANDDCIA
jgi:hypothetical protein